LDNKKVIRLESPEIESIFDSLDDEGDGSFGTQTLSEISMSYGFCLPYLGDFCVQTGVKSPINVNIACNKFLNSEQINELMTAVTTLDSSEVNEGYYGSQKLGEIADELKMSIGYVLEVCENKRFNIPFGAMTILHKKEQRRLRELLIDSKKIK
jgi:hypothetical protein